MRSEPQFSPGPPLTGLGQVEYLLARNSVVREYHRGRLSRLDICDAQPELLRLARNLGSPTEDACPICEEAHLVHVSFAFGPGFPPGGRPLASVAETNTVARTKADVTFYVVEVCTECSWNHLLRMFTADRARRSARRAPATGGTAPS